MHPEVLRAVSSARIQDLLAAAERSEQVRQARRAARHAIGSPARPGLLGRAWRRRRPAPVPRHTRLVPSPRQAADLSPAAAETTAERSHAGHRAA
jgi:hypothetical protein